MKTIAQRLEHLQRIQDCIDLCNRYNSGDMFDLKRYADMWQWLGMDVRVKAQIKQREKTIEKLTAFFAKKAMELAIESATRTKSPLLADIVIGGVHVTEDDLTQTRL